MSSDRDHTDADAAGQSAHVRVYYQGQRYELTVPRAPLHPGAAGLADAVTVLDVAEQQGLDLPYSCCSGVCATCFAKVTHGTCRHLENHVLDAQDLADGYILVCQAVPTSTELDIVYDPDLTPQLLPLD